MYGPWEELAVAIWRPAEDLVVPSPPPPPFRRTSLALERIAYPQFGGEAPGDVTVGVGLTEEDQVRGAGGDSFGEGGRHWRRGESIAAVQVQDRLCAMLPEHGEDRF